MIYATNSDEVDMTNSRFVTWEPDSNEDPTTAANLRENREFLDMLRGYLPPGARVLDYGAGYCDFLRVAKQEGFEVEGINPCKYLADWANEKLDIQVHATFGIDFDTDKKYDLILSDQTFEHLIEPRRDLAKLYGLLNDNGIAYINVPNWRTFRRLSGGVDHLKDFSHYNYFTPRTLADLCCREGFQVLRLAPVTGSGLFRSAVKLVLNKLGIGHCSVIIKKQQ